MSKTYTNSNKCCGTCANWAGARTVQGNGFYAYVQDMNARAKCYMGLGDAIPGPTSCYGHSCSKYTKWPALK